MAPTPRFGPEGIAFLRALAAHNEREWFRERKEAYLRDVRGPMLAIVEHLSREFRTLEPHLEATPQSIFRPYRDTRFSDDKTPLKTNIAATFPNRTLGRMNGAGMYLEVAPGWVWIGGGLWRPDTSQLQLVREHIAANHKAFAKIVGTPRMKKIGGLQGDRMSRVPRGFAKDHPAADFLQHRQFLAFREEPANFATSKTFYLQLKGTLETIAPLVAFLNEPLISSLSHERRAHAFDKRLLGSARGEDEEYSSSR